MSASALVSTNTGKVYHDTLDVDVNFKVTATYRNYSYSDQKKVKVLAFEIYFVYNILCSTVVRTKIYRAIAKR